MRQIRFRFDPEKLVHALAFFSVRGVTGLDTMKSAKLLFLADKLHLTKYGRPILGDDYYCMKHGPIPTLALNVIQSTVAGDEATDDVELMTEYLEVKRDKKYPYLVAKKEPDLDVFSDSDIEVLREVIETYGSKTAWQLRELTHELPEVKAADEERARTGRGSVPIPFEALFDETAKAVVELLKEDQESRDFAASLTW